VSTLTFDWKAATGLSNLELRKSIFNLVQQVSKEIQRRDPDDPELLGVVPRIFDLLEGRQDLHDLRELAGSLARSLGLWNYIDRESGAPRERLLAETFSYPELGGITLHREQVNALSKLLSGKNLILSAPTSFGKSVLVDALLTEGQFNRVVVVLPTIALLDEFSRRLDKRFGDQFSIITHHSQPATDKPAIYIGTQERLIGRTDLKNIDLLVVDEFYKLDPHRKDERSTTLNAAVYRLLKKSKQFFFLGPNIDAVQVGTGSRWNFEFLRTRFSTVAVDTLDLSSTPAAEKEAKYVTEIQKPQYWPALTFASSPDRANSLAQSITRVRDANPRSADLAQWLELNFGGSSLLSQAVARGIGIHHARLPRSVAARMVWAFNDESLPILICTSTLIEGVNTAARSVFIYDKKISRSDYDFFTFSNIKGRAGRLGEHHVGQVVLFHDPPDAKSVDVAPTLFSDVSSAPDELVVHLEDDDMPEKKNDRLADLSEELSLSTEELRRLSPLGIENLRRIRDLAHSAIKQGKQLTWSGHPNYEELLDTIETLCKAQKASTFGARTAKQLVFYIRRLSGSSSLREFYESHSANFTGEEKDWDSVFKFIRACDYSLPEHLAALGTFAKQKADRTDYSFFIASLTRWFRPEVVKDLEERGIPAQISERFAQENDDIDSLTRKLHSEIESGERLTDFEINWISRALGRVKSN
jgi:hypothetical protein